MALEPSQIFSEYRRLADQAMTAVEQETRFLDFQSSSAGNGLRAERDLAVREFITGAKSLLEAIRDEIPPNACEQIEENLAKLDHLPNIDTRPLVRSILRNIGMVAEHYIRPSVAS